MKHEELEEVSVNVRTGSITVNGKELSGISYFNLEFDECWHLTVTEDFFPRGKKIQHPNKTNADIKE